MSIRPEPGMTYEFEVEDVFYLTHYPTVIVGTTSVYYTRLYPALAEIFVNGEKIHRISIDGELHPNCLDPCRRHIKSLVSNDKPDLKPYIEKGIILKCVFTEDLNAQQSEA